jgi:sugar porter (SP) family MFS transporter
MGPQRMHRDFYGLVVALAAACAGLLFGYDAGVISGALLFIKGHFHMSGEMQGLVVSAVPMGALVASALTGKFSDLWGRRRALSLAAVLFALGAVICALSASVHWLVTGRLILGLAVGVGSFSAPLYIAEVANKKHRGAMVTLNQFAIVIGICLAYLVNLLLAPHGQWRYMLGIGLVPALVLWLAVRALPESPRWLISRGNIDKARAILKRMLNKRGVESEISDLTALVSSRVKMTMKEAVRLGFGRVLTLGVMVSVLTQAIGINAVIYYAPTIFKHTGFHNVAILATLGIGLVNVLFTGISIFMLDLFGRRRLLMVGISGIVVSLVALTFVFFFPSTGMVTAWVSLISMFVFVASQAIGTGPACWLIPSEIFPTKLRGLGMGLSVASNWAANVVAAFFFPIVLLHAGPQYAFGAFLVIALGAWWYFYRSVPETKNLTLEQIEANLKAGVSMRNLGRVQRAK